jgi:hypothetical protein
MRLRPGRGILEFFSFSLSPSPGAIQFFLVLSEKRDKKTTSRASAAAALGAGRRGLARGGAGRSREASEEQ